MNKFLGTNFLIVLLTTFFSPQVFSAQQQAIAQQALVQHIQSLDNCYTQHGIHAQDTSKPFSTRSSELNKYNKCRDNVLVASGSALLATQAYSQTEKLMFSTQTEVNNKKTFLGQNFGLGFAITKPSSTLVSEAEVVDGVLVAKKQRDMEARVLLEFHSLLWGTETGKSGWGPFVAIATNQQDVLGGLGLGVLYSWKNSTNATSSGFSIGFGVLVDNEVKDLAKGFNIGDPLPTGESAPRFVTENRESLMLFFSNTF